MYTAVHAHVLHLLKTRNPCTIELGNCVCQTVLQLGEFTPGGEEHEEHGHFAFLFFSHSSS